MDTVLSYLSTPPRGSKDEGDDGDGTTTPPTGKQAAAVSNEERVKELEQQVNSLLTVCAENEIDVPKDMGPSSVRSAHQEEEEEPEEKEITVDQHHQATSTSTSILTEMSSRRVTDDENEYATEFETLAAKLRTKLNHFDIRVENGAYSVTNYVEPGSEKNKDSDVEEEKEEGKKLEGGDEGGGKPNRAKQHIPTIQSASILGRCYKSFQRLFKYGTCRLHKEEKIIMDGVNLYFETGKMYLVLGGPGSGKSTLLKMIANKLMKGNGMKQEGTVTIAGISPQTAKKRIYWNKFVGYIDQIDRLHPFLTVKETCVFAWRCRFGGTHALSTMSDDPDTKQYVSKLDGEMYLVNRILDILGLARVKDTFVGDQEKVRGVSGGERKRVTVAEMMVVGTPVQCMDEISTGLDAATTYDITQTLGMATRMTKTIRIVSLLQPPPETVANFDEIILVAEGKVIYSGPLDDVLDYFGELGYEIPERMDVADWLQTLPTAEGSSYLKKGGDPNTSQEIKRHMSVQEFHDTFYASEKGKAIIEKLNSPADTEAKEEIEKIVGVKYRNPWWKSLKLVCDRELLLWWRDKYQIKAKVLQTLIMGTIVGTLFFQSTDTSSNVLSVAFQSMFYSAVGAMVLVVRQFPDRAMFYKQQDASFFPPWAYVIGRSVASLPVALTDAVVYGTMIFWLVGLAYNDGARVANYFVFMALLFTSSLISGFLFSTYPSLVQVIQTAQACNSLTAIVMVLFSGFTVQPDVIPNYYIWIYWINPFSWLFRGIVVNEFDSGKYDTELPDGSTEGESLLTAFGMVDRNGDPYTIEWAGWAILYCFGLGLLCMMWTSVFYSRIRFATGKTLVTDKGEDVTEDIDESDAVNIPFTRVDLTFQDLHYVVTASTTDEKLELLKGIDGVVYSGEMTALMGSSGAGKTTLMDVIAMRKTSGEITGDIRLNGHPQEERSFRRCMGYVEQFDQQSAQLTVRETMMFSAKLRLDENDPAVTPESISKFVDQTLAMLELSNIQNLQVGTDETGGLSFEQKKRLSIGVETVANPSVIFLDEPTSGLDARAAAIVMRGMKRIALQGRAVCATIHQPSIAIFNEFDRLLLLKRGGEAVFQGVLGEESCHLINYFERFPTTKPILPQENPATWMLTTIGAGSSGGNTFDYAASYAKSTLLSETLKEIEAVNAKADDGNLVSFQSKYATDRKTQRRSVFWRTALVYFRSPQYNTTRVFVSGIVALLFSTVYATQRVPTDESDMNSRINSVYISIIFLMVNGLNTVLSVFERERNMYYRHKAANMYRPSALTLAFTFAELPFILYGSMIYCVLFYFIMGFSTDPGKFFLFYLFTTLGLMIFTFTGQMLMSLFRDAQTAQGLGGVIVTCTSLFSGVLISPDQIPNFWIWLYWLLAGHWVFEGIFMSQFAGDDTPIEATTPGTPYWDALGCTTSSNSTVVEEPCVGTAEDWVRVKFPTWSPNNIKYDFIYLIFLVCAARLISWWALMKLNYRAT